MGLAGLAGSVAGSYYLNKKIGGNTANNGYYPPEYYGSGYGTPYGYPTANGYPTGYQTGYPVQQGYGYYGQPMPGAYGPYYGRPGVVYPLAPTTTTIRSRPYSSSSIGVPTGSMYSSY
jgi:hypothetical protein